MWVLALTLSFYYWPAPCCPDWRNPCPECWRLALDSTAVALRSPRAARLGSHGR